jgi:hypothetical protein
MSDEEPPDIKKGITPNYWEMQFRRGRYTRPPKQSEPAQKPERNLSQKPEFYRRELGTMINALSNTQ